MSTYSSNIEEENSGPSNQLAELDEVDATYNEEYFEKMSINFMKANELITKGDVKGLEQFIKESSDLRENGSTVLHLAAMIGNPEFINKAVKEFNYNPNHSDYTGIKPLHWASFHGHVDAGRMLLTLGANPNLRDNDGQTPMNLCLKSKSKEFVDMLVNEFGANINAADKEGNTFLHILCGSGEFDFARHVVETFPQIDISIANERGVQPIHLVCEYGEPDIVEFFVEKGAKINATNVDEQTPFILAVLNHNFDVCDFLIQKYNCDINGTRRMEGEMVVEVPTPLHLCAKQGEAEAIKWLIEKGANYDIQTDDGFTALHVACEVGEEAPVKVLLDAGANPNLETSNGVHPIHIAANNPSGTACLKHLLNHINVVPNVFDNSYLSPLHYACSAGSLENVELLVSYHANIDIRGDDGTSPIFLACAEGEKEIVDYLLSKECDIDTPDENGNTPLHIAALNGDFDIVDALVRAGANPFVDNNEGLTPDGCADIGGYTNISSHLKRVNTMRLFNNRETRKDLKSKKSKK